MPEIVFPGLSAAFAAAAASHLILSSRLLLAADRVIQILLQSWPLLQLSSHEADCTNGAADIQRVPRSKADCTDSMAGM